MSREENVMKTATVQKHELPVGELLTSKDQVRPQAVVNIVAERFFSESELEAIAVVDGKEPVGLVTRAKLLFTLSRRFGFELYGKHPIIDIADTDPLIVTEKEPLDVVIALALERPPQDIYDEIIVTCPRGLYRGLLSVKQLVIQQSNALANSILQKEMASARAKELEKINQVKSQFIAHVTHELRSPVNAIIALAELLKMAGEKGQIARIKERLSLMISSATNLRAIITNILDLSKLEAGKMEVAVHRFDLTELLSEVAETTRILIGDKPVVVEVTAPARSVIFLSDAVKIRQILVNLMSNAAKFTEQGHIRISFTFLGDRIELSVSDSGIGIKPEDLERLFTAFTQIEDAKTKRHEGTGLGLTISRSLAQALGGEIRVSSIFGEGTVFTVTLPVKQSKKEEV